jgi:hypothetical protein
MAGPLFRIAIPLMIVVIPLKTLIPNQKLTRR